jgi:multisubunit Na+/H+ antiporter MnhF subunit
VNAFLIAALALLAGFVLLGIACLVLRPIDGVVAVQLAGATTTLILICLSEGFHRSSYMTVAIVCAVMTSVSGLVFARFIARVER